MTHRHHADAAERHAALGVLTVSDTRRPDTDESGRTIQRLLEAAGHRVVEYRILPDEPDAVRELLRGWLAREDCDGAVVCGGTGISSRDRTYEAVTALLERRLDGFGELFRALSYREIGSSAMLSRAVAGVARGKVLFSLPGAPAAAELALRRLILPEIGHLLSELER